MEVFGWDTIVLGSIQLSLLLLKLEEMADLSHFVLLLPTTILTSLKILTNLLVLLAAESRTGPRKEAVQLLTLGLVLCSLVFLIEDFGNLTEALMLATVPLFMILALHAALKVYENPPRLVVSVANLIFPTVTVCTLNGTCSTVYLSFFSPLLTALGVSMTDLVVFLRPLSYLLLLITLISIYKKTPTIYSAANVGSVLAVVLIYGGQHVWNSFWVLLVGNGLLIASVVYAEKTSKCEYKLN